MMSTKSMINHAVITIVVVAALSYASAESSTVQEITNSEADNGGVWNWVKGLFS